MLLLECQNLEIRGKPFQHLESIIDWPRRWKVVEEDVKMTQVEDVATAVAGSKPISRK